MKTAASSLPPSQNDSSFMHGPTHSRNYQLSPSSCKSTLITLLSLRSSNRAIANELLHMDAPQQAVAEQDMEEAQQGAHAGPGPAAAAAGAAGAAAAAAAPLLHAHAAAAPHQQHADADSSSSDDEDFVDAEEEDDDDEDDDENDDDEGDEGESDEDALEGEAAASWVVVHPVEDAGLGKHGCEWFAACARGRSLWCIGSPWQLGMERADGDRFELPPTYNHASCPNQPLPPPRLLAAGDHYKRRCRLVAPCCGEVFWCRHCHNAAKDDGEQVGCGSKTPHQLFEGSHLSSRDLACLACKIVLHTPRVTHPHTDPPPPHPPTRT